MSSFVENNTWIDRKWVGMISGSLDRFKWVDAETANFRCKICGDSKKSKTKARGYIYKKGTAYFYRCHNCGASLKFSTFLKNEFPSLYKEYKLDILADNGTIPHDQAINTSANVVNDFIQAVEPNISYDKTLDVLPPDHKAVVYCRSRMIPESSFNRIMYTDNFKEWVVEVLKAEKYRKRFLPMDARILLPLTTESGKLIGVQGRSLDPNAKARYITIKKSDMHPKIFGLDHVDTSKPMFATEGPIDSLFIPNSIAFCGGDVSIPIRHDPKNVYILLDNEPRHKDTIYRMESAITKGYNVMFWNYPSTLKDINDMVKGGYSVRDILSDVKLFSKSGAAAKLALAKWKRI